MTHIFSNEHNNPKDSQLIVAITGTSEHIKSQLQQLLDECNSHHGKPCQGRFTTCDGYMDVATPMWDRKTS